MGAVVDNPTFGNRFQDSEFSRFKVRGCSEQDHSFTTHVPYYECQSRFYLGSDFQLKYSSVNKNSFTYSLDKIQVHSLLFELNQLPNDFLKKII